MTDVEVNTIDQYQGRDKDLIIMSFVKSQIFQSDHKVSLVYPSLLWYFEICTSELPNC